MKVKKTFIDKFWFLIFIVLLVLISINVETYIKYENKSIEKMHKVYEKCIFQNEHNPEKCKHILDIIELM